MKGSASELKAFQSRSKVEFPAALGEKIRKERLSRSKQAFLIDSDTELFMYLNVLGSAYEKYGVRTGLY